MTEKIENHCVKLNNRIRSLAIFFLANCKSGWVNNAAVWVVKNRNIFIKQRSVY